MYLRKMNQFEHLMIVKTLIRGNLTSTENSLWLYKDSVATNKIDITFIVQGNTTIGHCCNKYLETDIHDMVYVGDCNIPANATLIYDIDFVGIYSGNRK